MLCACYFIWIWYLVCEYLIFTSTIFDIWQALTEFWFFSSLRPMLDAKTNLHLVVFHDVSIQFCITHLYKLFIKFTWWSSHQFFVSSRNMGFSWVLSQLYHTKNMNIEFTLINKKLTLITQTPINTHGKQPFKSDDFVRCLEFQSLQNP